MFRAATRLLTKPKLASERVVVTHTAVSPYALFLLKNADHKALQGLDIRGRANVCGKLWRDLPQDEKKTLVLQALKAEPFLIHKGLPRRPPPFARYIKKYWSKSPADLPFEDRVLFLSERFHKSLAARKV